MDNFETRFRVPSTENVLIVSIGWLLIVAAAAISSFFSPNTDIAVGVGLLAVAVAGLAVLVPAVLGLDRAQEAVVIRGDAARIEAARGGTDSARRNRAA